MEPPSYEEVNSHCSIQTPGQNNHSSPPVYTSTQTPSTPPPTYGEAVYPCAFPVLTPPSGQTAVATSSENSRVTVHPLIQVGERASRGSRAPTVAVVSQPQPVPIILNSLRDSPGFVRCPHCLELVTSNVTYVAGRTAVCSCVIMALMGLFCGFCLIPLCMRRLQDAHHSCPQCGEKLYVYER
ncbi:lipopolysaccharide-induced tumor necrosis factor-alpha factor homolog [Poeciliopsis prolifica]|uniref:lipopolysaccharide-induced tumor necrosis factor-alpha factor homolog n=1 Tax=Poeciliopsis prolifica TaxID=188132 RepID=UPI0024140AFA|nr:lipopolysaccharide-induced tumor necrosis factor-alpha factor homolog [Poeciliopsis prolifica]XP_054879058.1 lipopolysaccharide-induced tumor necrosis factor-alpha factor homolog [Poeciliopsis prolifica]XP_054879059.1 lipopolysaccharide-induced tumor necrosis factor-alpha factor homolog [Poeciliopsis prolifica]